MNKFFVGLAVASLFSGASAFACDEVQQQDASTDATPTLMSQGSPAVVAPAPTKSSAKKATKTALKSNAKPDSVAMPLKTVSAQ
jgi:hypothetical protein